MILLGFRRKLTALALCKSIESAIQWFQIHHRITFATIQNPAVYLSGARVSIFSTLVPRLTLFLKKEDYKPDTAGQENICVSIDQYLAFIFVSCILYTDRFILCRIVNLTK